MAIHHTGHTEKGRPMGSVYVVNDSDFIIPVQRIKNTDTTILFDSGLRQKNKEGAHHKPMRLTANEINLFVSRKGKQVTSLALTQDNTLEHGTEIADNLLKANTRDQEVLEYLRNSKEREVAQKEIRDELSLSDSTAQRIRERLEKLNFITVEERPNPRGGRKSMYWCLIES
ncbi:MarR family transcriptional regulator [Vibrio parahaemolyticus]|nr:MarR family transcriptional regulator [Vibrio parahaemolyticus]